MKEKISLVIEKELWDSFKAYCKDNGMSFSKKIEVMISNELNSKTRREKKQAEIMEILAELVHEKKLDAKPNHTQEKRETKHGHKQAGNSVNDLKGLTERYLEKRGRLVRK